MEAAEDPTFLDAMRNARIKGALVGVESVTAEGLKDVYKGFNLAGDELVARLREFRRHGVHVLGSFIFGLAERSRRDVRRDGRRSRSRPIVTFAQFVLLTPFPGTDRFREVGGRGQTRRAGRSMDGVPITQHWLIPEHKRPEAVSRRTRRCRSRKSASARKGRGISFYSLATRLGALARGAVGPQPARVRAGLEALPADVREYGIATDSARAFSGRRGGRGGSER